MTKKPNTKHPISVEVFCFEERQKKFRKALHYLVFSQFNEKNIKMTAGIQNKELK